MLFFTILLAISYSSISADHLPQLDEVPFECPFQDVEGRRCLRGEDKVQSFQSSEDSQLGIRPDIPTKNATQSQLASERFCCYEMSCLDACGLYYTISDNFNARQLSGKPRDAMRAHPGFFNEASKDLLTAKLHEDPTRYTDNSKIIMAHYSQVLEAYNAARDTYHHLRDVFYPTKTRHSASPPN